MTNTHRIQPPLLSTTPPPPPQREPERRGGGGAVFGFLLGWLVWLVGFFALASAEAAETPMTHYTAAIGLAIIGATFIIIAVLYETAGRDR